jgi:hypothetical protein
MHPDNLFYGLHSTYGLPKIRNYSSHYAVNTNYLTLQEMGGNTGYGICAESRRGEGWSHVYVVIKEHGIGGTTCWKRTQQV